ncbi:MAG: PEP-CTERM sorting domain-containing protein, partial [Pirellulales bacterium]|nr:PEP-CTERM sorting domain-containing protein [Pirellulales bacterium]
GATTITGGTLALEGSASIATSSGIAVESGATFDVSGLTSTFTLGDGQTLAGNGTVVGAVIAAAGSSIEPGGSIGELTMTGDVTIGGTLEVQYNGAEDPAVDLLTIDGNLVLDGATFDFQALGDPLTAESYVFATFTPSGLTGTATESNVPEGYVVTYDNAGGTISLVLVPEPSSFILLGLGLLGFLGFAKVRRR